MKSITLESSPAFILLCIAVSVGYGFLLYRGKHPWSTNLNRILLVGRIVLVFLLTFLLLGPIIRQIDNIVEKPVFVILHDNSMSVKESTDSMSLKSISNSVNTLRESLIENGFEVSSQNLAGDENVPIRFNESSSDLQGALRKISNQYEGKSLAGVLLLSDGIYNTGLSPLYANYNFPVHTVGVGDTTQRQDIVLKGLIYNKIAYQGNKFPLRAEVMVKGYPNQNISISLLQGNKIVERVNKNSGNEQLLTIDFNPLAAEQGIQRFDVQVEVKNGEHNTKNNRNTAFIEVVEGKKKILVVASSPHPDLKALRSVIEKNSNYDFLLHIPGVQETEAKNLQPTAIDLVIFHQSPDKRGRTRDLFQRFASSKTSLFIVAGSQTDLNQVAQANMPLKFEQPPRQLDDVMPVINPAFSSFLISPEANTVFSGFPPVWVPFGKMQIPASAVPLLFQRVGSLTTDKPLLWVNTTDNQKIAFMLADGFWQWRLHEYSKVENTDTFDEVFGKLIQYLSTTDDKSKFRSYPVEQQFSDTETVVFESQVYNDIYEPVYGNAVSIELTDEKSKKYQYNYVISPGNARYEIGGLQEGVYRYKSSSEIKGKKEEVRGQFLVTAQQAELQNLTADFDLLRKLSSSTGGQFYKTSEFEKLNASLTTKEATGRIHSEEKYDSLLNLKWAFFLLLALASTEWFLRKYFGGY
ncbi:MAG TPA: VWA domain-containing protein [Cyclobacteriaceae bacterium]|nr:VWA domain-containing protein [Cyclobacteriaceae bacterium]